MDDLKNLVNFIGDSLQNGKPCILGLRNRSE